MRTLSFGRDQHRSQQPAPLLAQQYYCGPGTFLASRLGITKLELDWRWHRKALELGCVLSINPDAHSISELDLVKWGVAVARKGGVPKDRVLNAMSLAQMLAHLETRRRQPVRKKSSSPRQRKHVTTRSGQAAG